MTAGKLAELATRVGILKARLDAAGERLLDGSLLVDVTTINLVAQVVVEDLKTVRRDMIDLILDLQEERRVHPDVADVVLDLEKVRRV
jgi:hypothetical protein